MSMYLIPFVMEQTLNWRLDKEKEVHGVSVHLLMIDRLVSWIKHFIYSLLCWRIDWVKLAILR